ncbi:MAG: tetratricopeptide repeat protein [Acidobacteriota bacterium]
MKSYLIAGFMTVAGLATSLVVMPRSSELALIQFRNKEFGEARQNYEAMWKSGNRSVSVLVPLTQLYLQSGEVDRAVGLMEHFVWRHPDNVQARSQLGKLYQYAQRPRDYVRNLEAIAAVQPSESRLRQLARSYNFEARYDKQIEALRSLLDLYGGHPEDFLNLASLQASQGSIEGALVTLGRFEERHPEAVDSQTVEFKISLLLDAGKSDDALEQAHAWLANEPDPDVASRFISLFQSKEEMAAALDLLGLFGDTVDTHPHLLRQRVQIEAAAGRAAEAYRHLFRLYSSHRLPRLLTPQFLELALNQLQFPLAFKVSGEGAISSLPDWLLVNLAEAAAERQERQFARHILRSLPGEFWQRHPMAGAELTFLVGDLEAARRWMARAESALHLSQEEQVSLAVLYQKAGRTPESLRVLDVLASRVPLRPEILTRLGRLYLKLEKPERGLQVFQDQAISDHSPLRSTWALLAASAGQIRSVLDWLEREPPLSKEALTDLYFVASDHKEGELALVCARRLYRHEESAANRLRLVRALNETGRATESLPLIRPLFPGGPEVEQAYLEALTVARQAGRPVQKELKSYWLRQLSQRGPNDPRREEVVYALLDLKADRAVLPALTDLARRKSDPWFPVFMESARKVGREKLVTAFLEDRLNQADLPEKLREEYLYALLDQKQWEIALPHLRRLAREGRGEWSFAYEEALEELGKSRELKDFLWQRADGQEVAGKEKRSIGFRLLELGEKEKAEQVFFQLAQSAPPQSREVQELLFLWGPRPDPARLQWLEEKVRSASGSEKAKWIHHLLEAGAAGRAVALMADTALSPGQDPELTDAYLTTLLQAGEFARLQELLLREISTTDRPGRLRHFARVALQASRPQAAKKAFSKLLGLLPKDAEALKWLAKSAFAQSDYSKASDYINRFIEQHDPDYELLFYQAEILRHRKAFRPARSHYDQALKELSRLSEKGLEAQLIEAHILGRTGRTERAVEIFRSLLEARPDDQNLRADFAGLLMEQRRYEEAQNALRKK